MHVYTKLNFFCTGETNDTPDDSFFEDSDFEDSDIDVSDNDDLDGGDNDDNYDEFSNGDDENDFMDIDTNKQKCNRDDESDFMDIDTNKDEEQKNKDDNDRKYLGIMHWILIIFFRVLHKFSISNNAATSILSLFSVLLNIIAHPLSKIFPKTLPSAIKISSNDCFKNDLYVVCPREKCNALYVSGQEKCSRKFFGRVCGASLGFERQLSFEKQKWTPFKIFQFMPPSAWLKKMFASSEFCKLLDSASTTTSEPSAVIDDLSRGRIWNKFTKDGFFDSKYNVGLMMNVDWFTPFKRSEYKVGVILFTVLNLPREDRYKKKWTIVAG